MSFEIEGTLHKIYEIESKSQSFQTREFVITTEGTYPQYVKFQAVQDRVNIIEGHTEGSKIKVFFDLRGREWQGKFFTNLNAWKVEKVKGQENVPTPAANDGLPPSGFAPFESVTSDDNFQGGFDDLPF
jgi:single-strand DNA-binding protein